MQKSQIDTYIALDQAYKSGNTIVTDRVESIVCPQEETLPSVLQEILDTLKDTPIDEPELFAILEKDDMRLIGFTKSISASVNLDDFDALTVSDFISRCRLKILNKTDKDGVFKSTPNIDQVRLPRLSVINTLSEAWESGRSPIEFTDLAVSLVGLPDGLSLSQWERDLIGELFLSYVVSNANAISGVASDRTPFSRYLKNV